MNKQKSKQAHCALWWNKVLCGTLLFAANDQHCNARQRLKTAVTSAASAATAVALTVFSSTVVTVAMGPVNAIADSHSICYGTTSNGRVAYACELPAGGDNYSPYSTVARWLGRTWVHCDVANVVVAAYDALAASHPQKHYVYGETGLRTGGEFKPHKTHRNGLSVDFMTPVINADGKSVPLPTSATNKYGYAVEFDSEMRYQDLRIDFEAIAAHLAALKYASKEHGIGIWRVIFDPELQPSLRKTRAWPEISDITFSRTRSWVRHDDHYHVDFSVDCRPLSEWEQ